MHLPAHDLNNFSAHKMCSMYTSSSSLCEKVGFEPACRLAWGLVKHFVYSEHLLAQQNIQQSSVTSCQNRTNVTGKPYRMTTDINPCNCATNPTICRQICNIHPQTAMLFQTWTGPNFIPTPLHHTTRSFQM